MLVLPCVRAQVCEVLSLRHHKKGNNKAVAMSPIGWKHARVHTHMHARTRAYTDAHTRTKRMEVHTTTHKHAHGNTQACKRANTCDHAHPKGTRGAGFRSGATPREGPCSQRVKQCRKTAGSLFWLMTMVVTPAAVSLSSSKAARDFTFAKDGTNPGQQRRSRHILA